MLVEYEHRPLIRVLPIIQIPVVAGVPGHDRHVIGIRGYDGGKDAVAFFTSLCDALHVSDSLIQLLCLRPLKYRVSDIQIRYLHTLDDSLSRYGEASFLHLPIFYSFSYLRPLPRGNLRILFPPAAFFLILKRVVILNFCLLHVKPDFFQPFLHETDGL